MMLDAGRDLMLMSMGDTVCSLCSRSCSWQIRHLGTEVRDVLVMMIHTLSGKISDSEGGIDEDY